MLELKISNMAAVPPYFQKMVLNNDPNFVINRFQGYHELVEASKDGGQRPLSFF